MRHLNLRSLYCCLFVLYYDHRVVIVLAIKFGKLDFFIEKDLKKGKLRLVIVKRNNLLQRRVAGMIKQHLIFTLVGLNTHNFPNQLRM